MTLHHTHCLLVGHLTLASVQFHFGRSCEMDYICSRRILSNVITLQMTAKLKRVSCHVIISGDMSWNALFFGTDPGVRLLLTVCMVYNVRLHVPPTSVACCTTL